MSLSRIEDRCSASLISRCSSHNTRHCVHPQSGQNLWVWQRGGNPESMAPGGELSHRLPVRKGEFMWLGCHSKTAVTSSN